MSPGSDWNAGLGRASSGSDVCLGLRASLFEPQQRLLYACRRVAEMIKGRKRDATLPQSSQFPRSPFRARWGTLNLCSTLQKCKKGCAICQSSLEV